MYDRGVGGGWGDSHKGRRFSLSHLGGANHIFWSHLGCSRRNTKLILLAVEITEVLRYVGLKITGCDCI